ncbi:MAG: beta-ketoacyl-ACP synthase III [Chthonomonadales bacterium]
MDPGCNAGILGVGMALPERILTNADLERMVDTSDEWIVTRTGIRERRIAGPEDSAATLGEAAARQALDDAGITPEDLDLIICATTTGDYLFPATACLIQHGLGASKAAAFDLSAACAGFVFALENASLFVRTGRCRYALVIGADTLTRFVNWKDRSTCVLFGDGAAAAVVGPCAEDEGILATALGTDGSGAEQIYIPAGGARRPVDCTVLAQKLNTIAMRGAEVFKFAVKIMGEAALEALQLAGLEPEQVDLFIPHQANIRIIDAAAKRMGLPPEKVFVNVERYGNTSAASIGIALREALDRGLVRRGSVLVFVGFGAGLTWGANVLRWNRDEQRGRR